MELLISRTSPDFDIEQQALITLSWSTNKTHIRKSIWSENAIFDSLICARPYSSSQLDDSLLRESPGAPQVPTIAPLPLFNALPLPLPLLVLLLPPPPPLRLPTYCFFPTPSSRSSWGF
jgi:hypothetical protein